MAVVLGSIFAVMFYGCFLLVGWWFLLIILGTLLLVGWVVSQ